MGDSTFGYPAPPKYLGADIDVNPDTVGDPLPPSQFAGPQGTTPAAVTGGEADGRPRKRELRMSKRMTLTQGTNFGDDLGFNARSVIIDNNTGQWLYDAASRRYIPPACFGAVLQFPSGSQIGALTWVAPPGVTQPTGLVGSQAVVIYTEDMLDPSAGIVSGSGTGQPAGNSTASTPAATNVLDGFASVTSSGTTALITVPAGRTWVGQVGLSAATSTAAAATTTAVATGVIATANGSGVVTPPAGNIARVDAVAAANAAGGTVGTDASETIAAQRLVVVASAAGTAVVNLVATITNGTNPVVNGWAVGELQ